MTIDPSAVVSPPRADGSGEVRSAWAPLSRREHDMLTFEQQWWRRPGAKEAAIRERFGMTPTRYYQVLNTLVDRPDALAVDPLLVGRLRRVRAARRRSQSTDVLGNGRFAL